MLIVFRFFRFNRKFNAVVNLAQAQLAFDGFDFQNVLYRAVALIQPFAVRLFEKMFDKRFVLRNQNVISQDFIAHSLSLKLCRAVVVGGRGREDFKDNLRIRQHVFFRIVKLRLAAHDG